MLDGIFLFNAAELMLLVSIAAISLRATRMEVLSCIGNKTDGTLRFARDTDRWLWSVERTEERSQRLKRARIQDSKEISRSKPLRLSLHVGETGGHAKPAILAPSWAEALQKGSIRTSLVPAALPRGVRIYAV
jgi:hypothetical protein